MLTSVDEQLKDIRARVVACNITLQLCRGDLA
jgi:hypothetical protein